MKPTGSPPARRRSAVRRRGHRPDRAARATPTGLELALGAVVPDVASDPGWLSWGTRPRNGIEAAIVVPLLAWADVIGLLGVFPRRAAC
jgi:hypothetical protein